MERIDTERLKRYHPVEEVIACYGIDLRPSGRALVGRCPFHPDGGRPNLYVYHDTRSWFCYRCGQGGDAISFVRRIEGVGFREAVARLQGGPVSPTSPTIEPARRPRRQRRRPTDWGPDERTCLTAAVELYHNRLLTEPVALTYLEGRGLDPRRLEPYRLGYASGDELPAYLHWRRIPTGAAMRVGLLRHGGRETMARRLVVPEIRTGQPIWLVGRAIDPQHDGPKYLGLPGRKPLLGWESASTERWVVVTEGPVDWLVLRSWGFPAIALVGTRVRYEAVQALARFERVYLVLDTDAAGREAGSQLAETLGHRATAVTLPDVKDVAELALQADGRALFTRTLRHATLAPAA